MPHESGIYYLQQADQGLNVVKNGIGITFLAAMMRRAAALACFTAPAPCIGRDAKALQYQVGRGYQQPGDAIGGEEFCANGTEKPPKSVATVVTEDHLPDKVDDCRHEYDAARKQDEQEKRFLADRQ